MNKYGLWMLVAYLSVIAIVIARSRSQGVPLDRTLRFLAWFVGGSYLGAQLAGTLVALFAGHGLLVPLFSGGTGASWGGITGGITGGFLATRGAQKERAVLFHAGILAAPFSQMWGRLGCYSIGCCHGTANHGSTWSVVYENPGGVENALLSVPLYPVQIFEALGCLVIGIAMWVTLRDAPLRRTVLAYVTAYAVLRFGMETMRGDSNRGFIGDWSTAQVLTTCWCIGFGIVALVMWLAKKWPRPQPSAHAPLV